MFCNKCKKRNKCIVICLDMEKYLAQFYVSRRELPLEDRSLVFLLEDHLREKQSYFVDRHSEFLPELKEQLEKLPVRQKLIIEMRFFEGLTIREIGRKLNISHQTASERIAVAIEQLKKQMSNCFDSKN